MPREWLTVAEVAEHLGMTERWVRRQVENRAIPFTKFGLFLRFDRMEIDKWVEQQSFDPSK
jgi:excisionase family DNA binding protein